MKHPQHRQQIHTNGIWPSGQSRCQISAVEGIFTAKNSVREGEREKEGEKETDRQADGQAGRQTDRDRERYRQAVCV